MSHDISLLQELKEFVENQEDLPLDAPAPAGEIAERMERIKWDLINKVGDSERFAQHLGQIIRAAIDYVIDAPTLQRYSIDEIDPDEKTTIGKRIERLMKYEFGLPTGTKLDVILAGEEVDIKTTMGKNWMFSKSNHDHINLLIAYDERIAVFQLGLAYVQPTQLGAKNRDQKQSLRDKESISWLFKQRPYPANFLAQLPEEKFRKIISHKTGMKRVVELLRQANCCAIPRHVVCSVANQKDPMRRIRSNGGARDVLWDEGIVVLSGAYESDRQVSQAVLSIDLKDDEMMTIPFSDERLTVAIKESYRRAHELPIA